MAERGLVKFSEHICIWKKAFTNLLQKSDLWTLRCLSKDDI